MRHYIGERMKNCPRISIVLPVYNAQAFLPRCIESILNQTCSDFELIVVDDGSTDDSGGLCDFYSLEDERVKVFHRPNEGVSSARNQGLQCAKGFYISFIDSDDWIDSDYLETLLHGIEENDVEIAVSNHMENCEGTANIAPFIPYTTLGVMSPEEQLSDYFEGLIYPSVVWGKLYKRDLWDGRRFQALSNSEDTLANIQIVTDGSSAVLLDYTGYHHTRRMDGAALSAGEKAIHDGFFSSELIYRIVEKNYPIFSKKAASVFVIWGADEIKIRLKKGDYEEAFELCRYLRKIVLQYKLRECSSQRILKAPPAVSFSMMLLASKCLRDGETRE